MMIYRNFVATETIDTAEEKLNTIISQFKEAHIKEYADFIRIMNNWHNEIINSFNMVNGHKITNGLWKELIRTLKQLLEFPLV